MNRILTTLDVEQARQFYDRGYWKGETLYGLPRLALRKLRAVSSYAIRTRKSPMGRLSNG